MNGGKNFFCSLVLLIIAAAQTQVAQARIDEIGFWEETGARAVFHRSGAGWVSRKTRIYRPEALQNLPLQFASPKKWQVDYQGKSLGEMQTVPFHAYERFSQQGLQKIVTAPSVTFRQRSESFATLGNSANLRPVLLTNGKLRPSPSWENHPGTAAAQEKAKKSFIQHLDRRLNFFKDPNFKFKDKNRHVTGADLQIKASFHSKEGDLVGLLLHSNNSFPNCKVRPLECRALDPQWFWVKKNSAVFLGDAAVFIDAADVDEKGQQSFFFLVNRPADSGYAVLSPNGKRTEFTWGSQ